MNQSICLIALVIVQCCAGCATGKDIDLSQDIQEAKAQLEPLIPTGTDIEAAESTLKKGGFSVESRGDDEGDKYILAVKRESYYGVQKKWIVVLNHDGEKLISFENNFDYVGP